VPPPWSSALVSTSAELLELDPEQAPNELSNPKARIIRINERFFFMDASPRSNTRSAA